MKVNMQYVSHSMECTLMGEMDPEDKILLSAKNVFKKTLRFHYTCAFHVSHE